MRKLLFKIFNVIAAALGLSFFADGTVATAATSPSAVVLNCAPEQGMSRKQEVECACQAALAKGTIEALENFLAQYGKEDSACSALATTALSSFTGSSDTNGVPIKGIGDTDSGGYGQ